MLRRAECIAGDCTGRPNGSIRAGALLAEPVAQAPVAVGEQEPDESGDERPGDRESRRDEGTGLAAVSDALREAMPRAVAEIEVTPHQLIRLGEALLGVANELKQFAIADGRSTVPGFTALIHDLWPETREEPGAALDLVQHPVMLRNRLLALIREAEATLAGLGPDGERGETKPAKKPWQIWKR